MSDSDVIHQYKGSEKAKISTLDDKGDIISNEPKDIVKRKRVCVCVCVCVCVLSQEHTVIKGQCSWGLYIIYLL